MSCALSTRARCFALMPQALRGAHTVVRTTLPFFFNDTATTEIYTLSLHDALPISARGDFVTHRESLREPPNYFLRTDRKSTRLNSSHEWSSYAVFCLKKKTKG